MHTLHQLTAAPMTIELNDATYQLAPLSVRDLGRIERMATATHCDPCRASIAEIHQWLSGREGTAYALWLTLRRHHSETSGAWCRDVVAACTADELLEIQRALDVACGASLVAGDAPPAAESLHPSQRHQPIPWERIFRALSRAYGWTPRQLARMTLGQLVAYLDDEPAPADRVRLPAAEARALAHRKKTRLRRLSTDVADQAGNPNRKQPKT